MLFEETESLSLSTDVDVVTYVFTAGDGASDGGADDGDDLLVMV